MKRASHIWFERKPRLGYGVFEKLLRCWFMDHEDWYSIRDLKALIPELHDSVTPNFRIHLQKLVKEEFLEQRTTYPGRPSVPREFQYRRKTS